MKFTGISTLALATVAMAAPTLDKRSTVVDEIADGVNRVLDVVPKFEDAIVNAAKDLVTVAANDALQSQKLINTNLIAIINLLTQETQGLVNATEEAVEAVGATAQALTKAELQQLGNAINTTAGILNTLNSTIAGALSGLADSTKTLLKAEVHALANLIRPFVNPVVAYVEAIAAQANGDTADVIEALIVAVAGLDGVAESVIQSLKQALQVTSGLPTPGVPTPGLPSGLPAPDVPSPGSPFGLPTPSLPTPSLPSGVLPGGNVSVVVVPVVPTVTVTGQAGTGPY